MNDKQRKAAVATLIVVAVWGVMYLNMDRIHPFYYKDWLGYAVVAASIGAAAFVWLGRKQ